MDIQIYDVIDGVTAATVKRLLASGSKEPITLHINSPGGNVTDALAIFNNLRAYAGTVTAFVDGLAASAATLVMLAADEVVMSAHSLVMVHNPWTVAMGDSSEMRRSAETLDKAANEMITLYAERTGHSAEAVTAIMEAETWYNAEEAVAAGFAQRVEASEQDKPRMSAVSMAYLANITKRPEAAAQRRESQIAALWQCLPDLPEVDQLKNSQDINTMSVEQIRAAALNALGQGTTPTAPPRKDAGAFADNGNAVKDGMIEALLDRAGVAKSQDKSNHFRTMSLAEMARASLTEKGVSVSAFGTKMQMVGAAFTHTSSDFGHVLMNVSEKAMLRGWENSGETFNRWAKKGTLSNFHTAHRAGLGGFPSLPKVKEGAEYQYVTADDRAAPIALATYGGLFSITRQAIINDDMSVFQSIPANMGRAASRTIGDLVYAILMSNNNFTDGKPLFHTDHGNIVTNAEGFVPAVLGEARKQMRMQKDRHGNTLNIAPGFVIVPAALESIAMQVLRSTSVPGAETNSGIMNPVNSLGELVVESRLDANSPDSWYVAAEQGSDTVEVAYLDGVDIPYLEQQEGWSVDGVSYKCRIDAGVAPLDYRGMVRGSKA
ncbi:ClpP-like prohead protease/major capsid protein fusion protein [Vreelandella nigrificans]|uniref:ATP-dependent Clp protease proteolytic subunit n=1 Tax=Vreelandella nigrificans TaxID=2042704 RepID=A0A2A4HIN5_9GAMM|nr:ClpP-like prohead protease/major capsid protein fusion protein [Halomonas nigrificans]PCF95268.1 peptidase S14 [Halomonas nigrificans]